MKRTFALILLVLIVSGCSPEPKEIRRGMALRRKLLAGESCSFDACITADYGDKLHTFTVACRGDNRGNLTFAITEPETIAGITGTVSNEGGKLTFDDVVLQFELMADDQVTPVSAPWIFLKTLRGGCLTSAGEEDGLVRLTIDDSYEDDALQLDIWLDEEDRPVMAEILYGSRRILSLSVKNFMIS